MRGQKRGSGLFCDSSSISIHLRRAISPNRCSRARPINTIRASFPLVNPHTGWSSRLREKDLACSELIPSMYHSCTSGVSPGGTLGITKGHTTFLFSEAQDGCNREEVARPFWGAESRCTHISIDGRLRHRMMGTFPLPATTRSVTPKTGGQHPPGGIFLILS